MRRIAYLWIAAPLLVAGCIAQPPANWIADSQKRYLAAKAACETTYPDSMVLQSDCRTDAANTYIRPYYRYPDLMTRIQTQRREWAILVDRRKMTRATFNRRVAQAERAVAREEARRNAAGNEAVIE